MSPPMTTVANGFWTSAPLPWESAIGRNPSEATAAVNKTGRNREAVPRITTSIIGIPLFRRVLNSAMRTIPFNTATPNKAMNPTPAEMENGMSLKYKA